MNIVEQLSNEFSISTERLEKTISLIDEGNTIPFIARYRKEVTGSLDDTTLRKLDDRLSYLRNLEQKKEEVFKKITDLEKMTPEISEQLAAAETITEVEDIYRPFKPKKKTRASVAREKGLEPLAQLLISQLDEYEKNISDYFIDYINEEKNVLSADDAINGACDIIAEDISDDAEIRKAARNLIKKHGVITSKLSGEDPDGIYEMYYDYKEAINKIPGHRILALNRAAKDDILKVNIVIDQDIILNMMFNRIISNFKSPAYKYIARTIIDSWERLIFPSVEREIKSDLFDIASEGAIKLFSKNLYDLLMTAPVKGHVVLGLDPGYRTGCKLAVIDPTGKVLDTNVIYPTKPHEKTEESKAIVTKLINKYNVDLIAIGNGTASKESEIFVANTIKQINENITYAMVSEAGASVYSASEAGAKEFPDFDVTQRSAVSIARRLQDPLAELVKIDPKSIGVGQYQHDMKPAVLSHSLDGVVESCVNKVGVDVNTASGALLSYVSGINATAAKNIVLYRESNGEFTSRSEIKKVPKIGQKAYEQCAGFLRIPESKEILDNTAVHPESYPIAKKLLKKYELTQNDIKEGSIAKIIDLNDKNLISSLAEELEVGIPTLIDIIDELKKPGRDLRDKLSQPILRSDVMDINDLREGMEMTGTVRNVIDFGAFVDIGVHQDGLIHISQITEKYIKHPSEMLSVGDIVKVKIIGIDIKKNRIALSMRGIK